MVRGRSAAGSGRLHPAANQAGGRSATEAQRTQRFWCGPGEGAAVLQHAHAGMHSIMSSGPGICYQSGLRLSGGSSPAGTAQRQRSQAVQTAQGLEIVWSAFQIKEVQVCQL